MSNLSFLYQKPFSPRLHHIWSRICAGRPQDSLCVVDLSRSDHFGIQAGTRLTFINPNGFRRGYMCPPQREFYTMHIPLSYKAAISAFKDFRCIGSRQEELNLTDRNLPRLEKIYADSDNQPGVQELYGILCLPYAMHAFRD